MCVREEREREKYTVFGPERERRKDTAYVREIDEERERDRGKGTVCVIYRERNFVFLCA